MSTKSLNLTTDEKEYVAERERGLRVTINALKEISQFKRGDFLIAFERDYDYSAVGMLRGERTKSRQVVNSYGAPKKYTVVHVDGNGIPYMKELNKKGLPAGQLISPIRVDGGYREIKAGRYRFEIDPDYAESIIMDNEAGFNATLIHKAKSDAFKEITKHNKSIKLKFKSDAELLQFLKTLKVGDQFYKSIKTSFTILTLDPIPTTHNGTRLSAHKVFGTAQDSKGKVFKLDHTTFYWRAVYKAQPRSYNELKDPK